MTLAESLQPSISITIRFLQNIFLCKLCSDEILVFFDPLISGQPPFGSEWGGWAMHGCPSSQNTDHLKPSLTDVDQRRYGCLVFANGSIPPLGLVSLNVASNTTEDFRNGAPGRGPLQQPWDSLKGPNEEGLTPIWTCFIRDRLFF